MNKLVILVFLPILGFSQSISVEKFFKEYNYNCENYNREDLYEFFGFDIEDDVTPALKAIDSFCKSKFEINENNAYIIETNVNVRNAPSLKNGNVLFQINKTTPGSMIGGTGDRQTQEWMWYKPTRISIIDSTIVNDQLWYKVVGKKLSNDEFNNLKQWTDWRIINDSLYNSNGDNISIRDNHDRDHWIYHKLVHRFSNNLKFLNGKYSSIKTKEDWTGDAVSVDFIVNAGHLKGAYHYQPGLYDGEHCRFEGYMESNTKIEGQYICRVEGEVSDKGTLNISIMDNNAFEIFSNTFDDSYSSLLARTGTQYFRYKFEK